MSITLPTLQVGTLISHDGLTVFPLFSEQGPDIEYCLAEEALADGTAVIEEVSEAGSVPELLVDNLGKKRVLLLEGEELRGAKQNRILNTTVLVAAGTKLKIPVSCVEQGRWRYSARHFQASGNFMTAKLRRAVKESVGTSLKASRGHRADQSQVWGAVSELHESLAVESQTAAMSDAFNAYEERIAEYRDKLNYVAGAVGLAVAIGGRVTSVDFFDKPSTCQNVWPRLLSGIVFDAMESKETVASPTADDVEKFISFAEELNWKPVQPVGEGSEFRAESTGGDHASALLCDGAIVHGSIVAAV
jgi:hypothetical protein